MQQASMISDDQITKINIESDDDFNKTCSNYLMNEQYPRPTYKNDL